MLPYFIQLLAHMWGDYLFQTDRMATMKTRSWRWATIHALAYSLAFIFAARLGLLHLTWAAWLVIVVTHAIIDRLRLARYVVEWKNWLTDPAVRIAGQGPFGIAGILLGRYKLPSGVWWPARNPAFRTSSGYPDSTPAFMSVWLLIITDNVLHVTINFAALRWLS